MISDINHRELGKWLIQWIFHKIMHSFLFLRWHILKSNSHYEVEKNSYSLNKFYFKHALHSFAAWPTIYIISSESPRKASVIDLNAFDVQHWKLEEQWKCSWNATSSLALSEKSFPGIFDYQDSFDIILITEMTGN